MSDMFHKFDNLPDGYVPNNEPARRCCSDNNFIITGQSVSHSFSVPFNAEKDLADYEIIYKQRSECIRHRNPFIRNPFIRHSHFSSHPPVCTAA